MSDEGERLRQSALARVGRVLGGKYTLASLLGVGGTAAVYLGRNEAVGRPCAIKVLHGEHRNVREIVERFKREAFAANRVRVGGQAHPNVVDILDAGESDGCLYLVEELLEGQTLAAYLDAQPQRRLAPEVAVLLLRSVVHAMAVAHAAGVVHRDLKPDNVFLVDRSALGRPPLPKVLDFGIAQLRDARITVKSSLHGTPAYMPPEAFTDPLGVDARLDVWALGLMLYEMLTGTNPFDKGEAHWLAEVYAVQNETPPTPAGAGVWPPLRAVIRRCLQKDARWRFADATALLVALEAALEPDQSRIVAAGESADAVQRTLSADASGSPPRYNGLRFSAPWASVGEVLAVVELPELAPLRSLALTEPATRSEDSTARRLLRNAGANELAAAVAQSDACAVLSRLEIAGGGMTVAGVAAIADSARLATLAELALARNKLGDLGAVALADAPHLQWLAELDLGGNGITDGGAVALARSTTLASLARLDLSHNRLTDVGARAIAESPHLRALTSVILRGNPLSDELVAALRARTDRAFLV